MQRCLQLAQQGMGHVAPNPMVGSVIVHEDKIIGEGYHMQYGEAHAEVNAIASVTNQNLLAESTLYVNLEPCSHYGKTPPCADLIVQKGIKKVVIASNDPNPLVSGKGIDKLRTAGVEVVTNILQKEADLLNRRFLTFHQRKRPYIILKWAQSADGFMALNEPKQFWFSNEESKKLMHKWRTEEPGIMVGRNTVEVDDCELTARLWPGKNPTRILIDRELSLRTDKKIFNRKANTLVFNEIKNGTDNGVRYIQVNFAESVIQQVLHEVYLLQIQSVMIEGGAATLKHFIAANLWDEARIFSTRHVLGTGKPAPECGGETVEEIEIGTDHLQVLFNNTL